LNTGGSVASAQEIRSCIIVSINLPFYRWMKDLSNNEDFQSCIALNEKSTEEQYDLEILSRFLVLRKIDPKEMSGLGDVETFFTDNMIKIAEDKSYDLEEEALAFKKTFEILNIEMSGESFRKYDVGKSKFSGGFLLAPFEAIALGIGYNHATADQSIDLRKKIISLWSNPEYIESFGRGKDASTRLPKLIPLGRKLFAP
jgi:hypothetical protein